MSHRSRDPWVNWRIDQKCCHNRYLLLKSLWARLRYFTFFFLVFLTSLGTDTVTECLGSASPGDAPGFGFESARGLKPPSPPLEGSWTWISLDSLLLGDLSPPSSCLLLVTVVSVPWGSVSFCSSYYQSNYGIIFVIKRQEITVVPLLEKVEV